MAAPPAPYSTPIPPAPPRASGALLAALAETQAARSLAELRTLAARLANACPSPPPNAPLIHSSLTDTG